MKRLYFGLAALLFTTPAMAQSAAQQADPVAAVSAEWGTIEAASKSLAAAEAHSAEKVSELIQAYQTKAAENAALESRLATAMEWLKAAQGQK